MLRVGDKAPDFRINDQDGKPVRLSDFRGSKVVLYFYPRDMTPGCTAEACNLRDNYRSMKKKGYEILGVSTDTEKSHKKFAEKEKLPFRLLADTEKSIHESYGTWIEKSMYGRKYMGTARITFVIDEKGVIEDIIDKVDTKNHVSQILESKLEDTAPVVVKKKAVKKTTSRRAATTAKKSGKK